MKYMKKTMLLMALAGSAIAAQAGGLMTNTNYHIAFDRMMARGATFEIDAAYSDQPDWLGAMRAGSCR